MDFKNVCYQNKLTFHSFFFFFWGSFLPKKWDLSYNKCLPLKQSSYYIHYIRRYKNKKWLIRDLDDYAAACSSRLRSCAPPACSVYNCLNHLFKRPFPLYLCLRNPSVASCYFPVWSTPKESSLGLKVFQNLGSLLSHWSYQHYSSTHSLLPSSVPSLLLSVPFPALGRRFLVCCLHPTQISSPFSVLKLHLTTLSQNNLLPLWISIPLVFTIHFIPIINTYHSCLWVYVFVTFKLFSWCITRNQRKQVVLVISLHLYMTCFFR